MDLLDEALDALAAPQQGDCEVCGRWDGDLHDGACRECEEHYEMNARNQYE